ncbi:MAG: transcriptional regulator [Eubacteriaceae bacterium]|uniref:Transcriptional regulator n=1 Tax=Candidatus Pseudoramibacter fermentans TaxID=2594427 RepID=A0A6L5GTX9_9FIRM|nr:transcriptional regulator [Candidatus Pseudoramibacter fermentans]RRF92735.1 MAG: transcriptional regulator [Eubacteriaceae bacterium]
MANHVIKKGVESTQIDYKLSLETEKPKSWLKSVSAFANTQGGHIYFGYTNDTHEAIGMKNTQLTASKISELIEARISPRVRYALIETESNTEGRSCLDLKISCGPNYPYYYVHDRVREAYVRHGDRSVLATDLEINNLILKGQNRTYDTLPSRYNLSDVSFTLLQATYKKETGDDFILPRDLVSLRLVGEDEIVTNAGLLLCDQGYLKQSRIVCTRWKGTEKGSVDGDALDDQEYSDASLITLLNSAEIFVRNNSKNAWTIRGMRREEKSDYPYKAVREVLVNALMHRDYQIIGTEVHVDMFDDRMEITSPGGMFNGGRIQDMDLKHVPSIKRNEVISDIFGRLNYMDRRGSGIGRIINSYMECYQKPIFYSDEYIFLVTLPNRSMAGNGSIDTYAAEKTQLSSEKTQLSSEKTQLSPRKLNYGQDWELSYFNDVILKRIKKKFRKKTINQIRMLFDRYRYQYTFNRRNIAELFHITENGASDFLRKCLSEGIIAKEKRDSYRFVEIDNFEEV